MAVALCRTYSEQMLDIVPLYLAQGGTEPIDLDDLARFAIKDEYWRQPPSKMLQLCKRDFARAFRQQCHTDPQRRTVRTFHAARARDDLGKQTMFWADIRTAPHDHMAAAFQQRRNQIVGGCRQLKTDVDSYNDNNAEGKHIQMVFDFTEDLAEREQPTTYRPRQPR
jgi:hypothetical protein